MGLHKIRIIPEVREASCKRFDGIGKKISDSGIVDDPHHDADKDHEWEDIFQNDIQGIPAGLIKYVDDTSDSPAHACNEAKELIAFRTARLWGLRHRNFRSRFSASSFSKDTASPFREIQSSVQPETKLSSFMYLLKGPEGEIG